MTILTNIILILCLIFVTRVFQRNIKSKEKRIAELEGHILKISIAIAEYNRRVHEYNNAEDGINVLSKIREN